MEINDVEEEEFGFSRNYFLAKDLAAPGKKSTHKLSDIDLVDEQVLPHPTNLCFRSQYWFEPQISTFLFPLAQELRAAASNIEPKHEKEIVSLMNSYKRLYFKWIFALRYGISLL